MLGAGVDVNVRILVKSSAQEVITAATTAILLPSFVAGANASMSCGTLLLWLPTASAARRLPRAERFRGSANSRMAHSR